MSTLLPDQGSPLGASPLGTSAPAAERLSDLTGAQWKTGVAAWLGWLFDGLDMHLYTVVATPLVAELLAADVLSDEVRQKGSWIQASFLVGWAMGGWLFGRLGDRIGRCRALSLTILTYAMFTGLSFFAQTWWHLLAFRFLAALGIGGEWAVGASLLSETWPAKWRHWIAAVLQSAVNVGVLLAMFASYLLLRVADLPNRSVFLVGILPALIVVWIRKSVSEPAEWQLAKDRADHQQPAFSDLFRGSVRRITVAAILACATSLTAHWAFMYWFSQHLRNLPEVQTWTSAEKSQLAITAFVVVMVSSIFGNFFAAVLARLVGFRPAIVTLFLLYFAAMFGGYYTPREYSAMWPWLAAVGVCQGVFALFTMYLPPLFPTLLRTTGAGFCYNVGRVAAAFGTVYFGTYSQAGDYRLALYYASFLFLPAALFACFLPELPRAKAAS